MGKPRIFGEQVVVKVLSSDGSTPFIIDFDTCDITSLSSIKSFKGIGKRIPKHQTVTNGWKISLTRNKRDNALQALVHHIDMLVESGRSSPEFVIEHTTTHFAPTIDTEYVLGKDLNKTKTDDIYTKLQNIETRIESLPIIGNYVGQFINNGKNFAERANQVAGNIGKLGASAINSLIGATVEGITETYIYHYCAIAEPTSVDKRTDETSETIVFYSGTRTSKTVKNTYEDTHLAGQMLIDYDNKHNTLYANDSNNVGKVDVPLPPNANVGAGGATSVAKGSSDSIIPTPPIATSKNTFSPHAKEVTGEKSFSNAFIELVKENGGF